MADVLELVKETNEQVVLKVNADDPLTVALNPWIDGNWAYITVTRGDNHVMTFIKKDSSTWSIEWGTRGCTMMSDSLLTTKRKVVDFIENKCNILLEYCGQPVEEATIYFNSNFGKWQLTLEGRTPRFWNAHYWDKDAKNLEDMKICASRFVDSKEWIHRTAQTGIDVWKAVLA